MATDPAAVRSALDKADSIVRTCWENFKATEPTYVLRDLIVVEITKAIEAEREACAKLVDEHASHHAGHGRMTDASIINVVADAIRKRVQ